MIWLFLVAGAFELIGLGTAVVGLWITWAEFGDGQGFFQTLGRRLGKKYSTAKLFTARHLPRWIRRGRHHQLLVADAALAIAMAGTPTIRVGYSPLPSIEEDSEAFVAEVHRRLCELQEVTWTLEGAVDEQRAQRETDLGTLTAALEEVQSKQESSLRRAATGGMGLQAFGFVMLFVGLCLNVVASSMQAV